MAQKISFEFQTRQYILAHGHAPHGYGSWAFTYGDGRMAAIWAPSSTFGAAKRWIEAHIRGLAPADYVGTVTVNVLT